MRPIPRSPAATAAAPTSAKSSAGSAPLAVLGVDRQSASVRLTGWWTAFSLRTVDLKQVLAMSEQLLDLLQAGLPLDRALLITSETVENPHLCSVVKTLLLDVEKGQSLGAAVAKHPKIFPRLYVNMIKAGEQGGFLVTVLQRLIQYYQNRIEFRSFLITASIYPALLLVFGVVAVLGLITFVLPKFGDIFAGLNQPMPPTAAALMAGGQFLQAYGLYVLLGLAAVVLGFQRAMKTDAFRERVQSSLLKLPLLGPIVLKSNLASICRTWGTLLMGGVPILTGLNIVRELTDSIPIQKSVDRLAKAVQEGRGVAAPLMSDHFFPRLMGQLVRVGEEAGSLDVMLVKVADKYEADVKKTTSSLVAVFEPAMILFVGSIIGAIVISMLGAIFAINDMPL